MKRNKNRPRPKNAANLHKLSEPVRYIHIGDEPFRLHSHVPFGSYYTIHLLGYYVPIPWKMLKYEELDPEPVQARSVGVFFRNGILTPSGEFITVHLPFFRFYYSPYCSDTSFIDWLQSISVPEKFLIRLKHFYQTGVIQQFNFVYPRRILQVFGQLFRDDSRFFISTKKSIRGKCAITACPVFLKRHYNFQCPDTKITFPTFPSTAFTGMINYLFKHLPDTQMQNNPPQDAEQAFIQQEQKPENTEHLLNDQMHTAV